MSDLMIGNDQLLFIGKNPVLFLISCNNYFNTFLEICLCGKFTSVADCTERRLIYNIGKFCTGCAGSSLGNFIETNRIRNFNLFRMNLEDFLTSQ